MQNTESAWKRWLLNETLMGKEPTTGRTMTESGREKTAQELS